VRTLVPLAIATLLTACAVKAPPPAAQMRKEALPDIVLDRPQWSAGAGLSADPVQQDWLHTFNDPQLDALVQEAIAHNPDLRVAGARVEQAAQSLIIAQ
jgi:multidrug efflux system outer membrane protein